MSPDTDKASSDLDALRQQWADAWPAALEVWSRFTQLSLPVWCTTTVEEQAEQLTGSFAMIRLNDHAVVISLRQVAAQKLRAFGLEVLAHEIGHHVYCPGDLTDNARLLARTRAGLPTKEDLAPMVANLYTDLLINDRLQRDAQLNMAGVYQSLGQGGGNSKRPTSRMWTLYMRIDEVLWNLPRSSLAAGDIDARLNTDAVLGARLIRSYAKEWLDGAGRFACLCLPYLLDDAAVAKFKDAAGDWHDTRAAGAGGVPDGLTEIEDAETSGAIHPAEDPDLSGLSPAEKPDGDSSANAANPLGRATSTGHKSVKNYRQPFEYADVLKASGVTLPQDQIIARYYRELALPHLVRFPVREHPQSTDPHPEGLDVWDIGSPLDEIDWLATVVASPAVVPGISTRKRLDGVSPGNTPEALPIDLYLGIDCSGSMGNPASQLSYPILSGAIIALSALRAGSRVMVALSGEPGRTITTEGFTRDEQVILTTLTSYLGTGTTFGIHRLADTFANRPATARPVHVLIITDNDIFSMLDQTNREGLGWQVAKEALAAARAGGTYVLQLPAYLLQNPAGKRQVNPGVDRMRADGWNVANVDSMEQLLKFARAFSRRAYDKSFKQDG